MFGWCIAMGLTAAILALPYARHRKRRAERARIDLIRTQVEAWLSASEYPAGCLPSAGPKQPEDSPEPPTGVLRPRRRVVLSAQDLGTTLGPGWRFQ